MAYKILILILANVSTMVYVASLQ